MSQKFGKVSQIIGPVVDVSFDTTSTDLPNIYDSLEVSKDDGSTLVLEVQSHAVSYTHLTLPTKNEV